MNTINVLYGRILDFGENKQVGDYVYDIEANYIAYRYYENGGKARRFDGNTDQFLASLPVWCDITEDIGTARI